MAIDVYELFRKKSNARNSECVMKHSAGDRIANAISSTVVRDVRMDKEIPVSFIYNNKEFETDVIMESYTSDGVEIGDYIERKGTYFIVYGENKAIPTDQYFRKFKLVECNVSFEINNETIYGFYLGAGRKLFPDDETIKNFATLLFSGKSLMVIPVNEKIKLSEKITIEDRQWKIVDYDNISNKKIMYITLENVLNTTKEKVVDSSKEDEYVIDFNNSVQIDLIPSRNYKFVTESGYFAATDLIVVNKTNSYVIAKLSNNANKVVEVTVKLNNELVTKNLQVRQV